MKERKYSRVFRRFLFSYVIILLLPIVTGFITYWVSVRIIETSSVETSRFFLQQTKDLLERRMGEVEGFTKQLAKNYDLNILLNERVEAGSYHIYDIWKIQKNISPYEFTNDFLEDFYIYLDNYDLVITPLSIFFRSNHYYELNHYENLTFKEWKTMISVDKHQGEVLPSRPFISNERNTSVLTYIQSLPVDGYNTPKGTVVVLIDKMKIDKLLGRILDQYGGWSYIADGEGRILTAVGIHASTDDFLKLNTTSDPETGDNEFYRNDPDEDTMIISTRSVTSGWTYVVGIPKSILLQKSYYIQKITWAITAITFLTGIIISLLLAYRNSLPINKLLGIFREYGEQTQTPIKNEYDFLRGNITNLMSNHKFMEEEMLKQLPLLKDAFIKRMIKGEFNTLNEIEAAMQQADIQLAGTYGVVGIARIQGYNGLVSQDILNELNTARMIVKRDFAHRGHSLSCLTDLDSDKIVFIFTVQQEPDAQTKRDMEALLNELMEQARAQYNISIIGAMGAVFNSLTDIPRSFDEAGQALNGLALTNGQSMLWYENVSKETMTYYFPIELEFRLMNTIKGGEYPEAARILDQVFEQNFVVRLLSADMALQFIGEIKGTLFKLIAQRVLQDEELSIKVKQQIEQIQHKERIEHVQTEMKQICRTICDAVAAKKAEGEHSVLNEIIRYLADSYSDPNLTLYRVSEALDRPEKYISQLFKEQTGESLPEYLEKVRIKKASELLLNTENTIDEISQDVGYNSPHSFRRAFKRVYGLTPSMYRHSIDE